MILQNSLRRVGGSVLINTSPSNIFPALFLLERFHRIVCQAEFGCFEH